MAKCAKVGIMEWILVATLMLVPCFVVVAAMVVVEKRAMTVLAVALAVYCSILLVWIIFKCRQRKSDDEESVLTKEEELPGVAIV